MGVNRYLALMLEFLSRRVLGQFDPQLLGREPVQHGLYLVEPNVSDWERPSRRTGKVASIKLTKAGRKLLAKSRSVRVRVSASVTDSAGNRAAASATRKLRR